MRGFFVEYCINANSLRQQQRKKGKNQFKNLPAKDALMFTQIGILRAQEKSVEEILLDGAIETDNITELLERDKHLIGKTCKQ